MNKTNFVQTGGFPLNTERLEELEKAYSIFNAYGALAGDLTIISGCVTTGSNVSDGYVYISGELFPFRAAAVTPTSTVIIVEQKINRPFESSEIKTVHTLRYATFGTAETSWAWSDFKLLDPITELMRRLNVLEKKSAVFQAGGGMVFWNKPANEIPEGWQEVVDWRGRMPVGFDSTQVEFNAIGKVGGSKTKALTVDEMPPHNHGFRAYTQSGSNSGSGGEAAGYFEDKVTTNTGGGQSFSILNPFRTVLFIEFIE